MFNHSSSIFVFAVIFACLNFGTSSSWSQETAKVDPLKFFYEHKRWYTGSTEAWFYFFDIPEADVRKSIEHWEEIGKDLKDIDGNLQKGRYSSGGSTHGSFLRFSNEKGFIWLHVNHCQGGPLRILRGSVEVVPEGVVLVPEILLGSSAEHSGHVQFSSQPKRFPMIVIKWMDAVYLVQKDHVGDFADYSAGLGDYNGNFPYMFDNPFLAMGIGEEGNAAATYTPPTYPLGYEKYHRSPIRGSIKSIGEGRRRVDTESDMYDRLITPVKIKLEKSGNFSSPIKLLAVGQEMGFTEEFELRSIKGNIATVEHTRLILKRNCVVSASEDCTDPDHLKPRVGMVLSSNGL